MDFKLTGANIVLLANKHNPSIASKDWLKDKGIINEDITNFTHLPVASMVETDNINFFIDQDTLQISIKKISQEYLIKLAQMVLKYANSLPETPYSALGFNYVYNIDVEQDKLKNVFLVHEEKLQNIFSNDYQFGGIVKFPFEGFLITLKMIPDNEKIKADFNFHFELNNKSDLAEKLFGHLKTEEEAKKIIRMLLDV